MKEIDFTLESGEDIEFSLSSEPSLGFDLSESPVEIGGDSFDIHALTTEDAIADADELPFYDVSASGQRKTTWSNIKSKLKWYFDTLYLGAGALTGYATQAWVNAQGFITSLVGYATQVWVQSQGYGTYSKPTGGIPASDLAAAVQTSLDKADSFVTPEQYGAAGNGAADDTQAFQAALDGANGKAIVCNGTYKITQSLTIPYGTTLITLAKGEMQSYVTGTLFVGGTFGADHVTIEGIRFTNKNTQTDADGFITGNAFAEIHHSVVARCVFDGFYKVANGISNCTNFAWNICITLRHNFVNSIVDSYITNNYINASRLGIQESIMIWGNMSNSLFEGNFCDFWNSCFRLEAGSKSAAIIGNTFDNSFCVFRDYVTQATITGNTFSNIKYVEDNWSGVEDVVAPLINATWCVWLFDKKTVSHATGNATIALMDTIFSSNLGRNIDGYICSDHSITSPINIRFCDNKILDYGFDNSKISFKFMNTSATYSNGGLRTVYFDFLEKRTVSSLTSDTFFGDMTKVVNSNGGTKIYDGLHVMFEGHEYVNRADASGNSHWTRVEFDGDYVNLVNKPAIDTTVTSGSQNLITSGAVYATVGNIEAALTDIDTALGGLL